MTALAILFEQLTEHGADQVLFSGQDALPGLISGAGTWSVGALLMLIVCKGLAWGASLGGFRGGPTFPAIYLRAAGGIAASHLPGLSLTAGVAVGIGVMIVAVLKLPLSAIVIATALDGLRWSRGGPADHPRCRRRLPRHTGATRPARPTGIGIRQGRSRDHTPRCARRPARSLKQTLRGAHQVGAVNWDSDY